MNQRWGLVAALQPHTYKLNMGKKGVIKFTRNIFKKVCKRDFWRSYEDGYKRDEDFLTKLDKLLESSEKCVTQLKKMEEKGEGSYACYKKILGKLNQHSYAGERLFKKVEGLITKQENMHKELTKEMHDKKQKDCARAWKHCLRMVTHAVFIGVVAAQFACTVVAAVLASPVVSLAVAAAIIPTLAGQHWTLAWIEESSFEYSNSVMSLMQSGTVAHKQGLGDIQNFIRRVITDINTVIEEEENRDIDDIERCLKNINKLKENTRKCKSEILEKKDKVSKSINSMKSICSEI